MRVECNSDSGDYSSILHGLRSIIKRIQTRHFVEEKQFTAKTLKTSLESVYALVKSHCMNGHSGVATVLFNELSGLGASSMIRRVNKTLQQSAGKSSQNRPVASSSRFSPGGGANQGGSSFAPRRGSFGGRGGFGNDGFRRNNNNNNNNNNNRGFGGNAGGNAGGGRGVRPPMICFNCLTEGHGYQTCRRPRAERPE